jgi:flavin-dependent dehydrogenase
MRTGLQQRRFESDSFARRSSHPRWWSGRLCRFDRARPQGTSVTLIEREPTPRHKVCGEFLSGEALEDLHALGIDVASLGAVPIDYVRLAAARRAAEAPLPFPAASLTRKALDTALIAEAIAAGVRVERGRSVQALAARQQRLASYARRRRHL